MGVVVGVGVNEAGAHDPVGGINRLDGLGFSQWPTAAMRPSVTATSARNPGSPEPSITVPPRMIRSYMGARLAVGRYRYLTERQVFGPR